MERAKLNLPKYISFYRLALCNLTNSAIEKGDLRQAEDYFEDLEKSLESKEDQAPILFYTRARLWFSRLRECQIPIGSTEFREEIEKIWIERNSMFEANKKIGPKSKSTIKKYKKLSDEILNYAKSQNIHFIKL